MDTTISFTFRSDLEAPEAPAAGWQAVTYSYAADKPHAVTAAGESTYSYDDNGNMTCRLEQGVTYVQTYNAENRLSAATTFDHDTQLPIGTPATACFMGGLCDSRMGNPTVALRT